jgi:Cof subfamily protein (haloacid dehalogenase superfamily)
VASWLVASDLDGTLLRSDGTVSDRTRAALAAAEDAGALVVIVTGRPPRWMAPVAEAVGRTGLAICANGAVIWDLERGEIVRENPIDPATAGDVVRRLRDALPDLVFAVERGTDFGREPGYRTRAAVPDDVLVAHADELVAAPIAKLLARHDSMGPDELLAAAAEVVGDLATLTHASTGGLLEISAAGVSKAVALEELAAGHGLRAADAVAFGDMPNDLSMLAWAGRGVAVANAHPDVLAAADEVTATNDEDGVAMVIERLVAERQAPGPYTY